MNELEKVLVDSIQKTQEGIGMAVDFAVDQAPDVIQQMLYWHATSSFLSMLLSIIVLCISIKLFLKANHEKWYVDDEDSWLSVCIGGAAASFISVIVICNNMDWLQILIAPKLWLIEYAASLVNKS